MARTVQEGVILGEEERLIDLGAYELGRHILQGAAYVLTASVLAILLNLNRSGRTLLGDASFHSAESLYLHLLILGPGLFGSMGITYFMLRKEEGRGIDPSVSNVTFWLLNIGLILLLVSWFIGLDVGKDPLIIPSTLVQGKSTLASSSLYLFAMSLVGISMLIYDIEVIGKYRATKAQGKGWSIFESSVATSTIIQLLMSIGLLAYISLGFMGMGGNPLFSSLPILNGLWLFTVPIYLTVILPILGLILQMQSSDHRVSLTRGPWTPFLVLGIIALTQFILPLGGEGFFGLNIIAQSSNLALMVAVFSMISMILPSIAKSEGARPAKWSMGWGLLLWGLAWFISIPYMIPFIQPSFTKTTWILSQTYLSVFALLLLVFGVSYNLLSEAFGNTYSGVLERIHVGSMILGGGAYALLLLGLGLAGSPSNIAPDEGFAAWYRLAVFFTTVFALGQVGFVYNIIRTLYRGKRTEIVPKEGP